jgi:hypothetical protein
VRWRRGREAERLARGAVVARTAGMQLRYVALAVVLILGCRKADGGTGGTGSGRGGGWSVPAQGEACPDGTPCESGLSCVKYVGVTGAPLATCEIPCKGKGRTCPAGQTCTMIEDGPGEVCQAYPEGPTGGGGAGPSSDGLPGQAEPCPDGRCAAGLSCVRFYGVAGPRGGELTSCEIRCGRGGACPGGQQCVTIADGPGQVCRPER